MISADRNVEIAQGIAKMYAVAKEYGLVVLAEGNGSDASEQWFTIHAEDAGNIVDVCDAAEHLVGKCND